MQGVIGGKTHIALAEDHHGDGKTLRQRHKMPDRLRVPSHCAGNDQGAFGGCQQPPPRPQWTGDPDRGVRRGHDALGTSC